MSATFSCCFCNGNGQGSLLGMIYNPIGHKIEYFRHNRSCEICRDSLKKNNMNFSSSKFTAIREDVLKCLSDPQFLIPAIDKILLPRFAKMFDGFDEYSFAFSSKKPLDLLEPKPLLVAKEMVVFRSHRYIPDFENSNILVTEYFEVKNIRLDQEITKYLYQKFFDSISSYQLFIKAKIIELCELQISSAIFCLLLSPQLVELKCASFDLTTLLNPVYFIEKIPNIEKFLFIHSSDKKDEFETLPINCKGLEKFCHPLKSFNLSVKSFSDIIKKWSRNQKMIFICIFDSENKFLNFPVDTENQTLYNFKET